MAPLIISLLFFTLTVVPIVLTIKYADSRRTLLALREINEIESTILETAIFVIEKWDELPSERRNSMTEKLQRLIAQSDKVQGSESPNH
jgi:hypothetical protein